MGKVLVNVYELKVDLMLFLSYKLYGLKGIGGLYVCCKLCVCLEVIIYGGGYECGMCLGILLVY